MKLNLVILVVACASTCSSGNTSTLGNIKTFDPAGGTGDWNVPTHWDPQGTPTGIHRVIIPSNKTCIIGTANATADTIVIEAGGWLRVRDGFTLTLENNTENVPGYGTFSPDNSIIDGELVLDHSPTNGVGHLAFSPLSHTVTGEGTLRGQDTANEIRVALGKTLTNQLAVEGKGIHGAMTIKSISSGVPSATLRNEGLVQAGGGTLVLHSTLNLQDIDGARWFSACKNFLRFERESLNLLGDIGDAIDSLGCGTIDLRETVRTCGAWINSPACGNILLSQGVTFEYAEYVDESGGTCPNPGTGGGTCTDPFILYDTVSRCGGCG